MLFQSCVFRRLVCDGAYGDRLVLVLLSLATDLRITVLRYVEDSNSVVEMRVRHNNLLRETDIVLVHDGALHYTAVGEYSQ